MEGLEGRLQQRMDGLEGRFQQRMDGLEGRLEMRLKEHTHIELNNLRLEIRNDRLTDQLNEQAVVAPAVAAGMGVRKT